MGTKVFEGYGVRIRVLLTTIILEQPFADGTGILEPSFTVMFENLPSITQIAHGLVALVNLSNPAGSGLVGRNKYFDDGVPRHTTGCSSIIATFPTSLGYALRSISFATS